MRGAECKLFGQVVSLELPRVLRDLLLDGSPAPCLDVAMALLQLQTRFGHIPVLKVRGSFRFMALQLSGSIDCACCRDMNDASCS
jgi:hypothetical protein